VDVVKHRCRRSLLLSIVSSSGCLLVEFAPLQRLGEDGLVAVVRATADFGLFPAPSRGSLFLFGPFAA